MIIMDDATAYEESVFFFPRDIDRAPNALLWLQVATAMVC